MLHVQIQIDAEHLKPAGQPDQVQQRSPEPLAPEAPLSSETRTMRQPERAATASNSRCWFSVVWPFWMLTRR
jgi:hypothetical protein